MKLPGFDWTIQVRDILVALSMIAGCVGIYTGLNSRVTALEQITVFQKQIDASQDKRIDEQKSDILSALKDIHSDVGRLADRIDNLGRKP